MEIRLNKERSFNNNKNYEDYCVHLNAVFIPSKEYALLPIVIISSESFFACNINSKFSFFVEALNSKNLFSLQLD